MDRPLFFMHIAKTAGSYVNSLLERSLGDGFVGHIEESLQGDWTIETALAGGVSAFSGHIYLQNWDSLWPVSAPRPYLVTVLREPNEHIASHIQWLDHYSLPEFEGEFQSLPVEVRRLVEQIAATDFGNIGHLDYLMTHLPAIGVQLLDNCQSRYFLCGQESVVRRHCPLSLDMGPSLRTYADRFDLILRQDQLRDGIRALNALTGLQLLPDDRRINASVSTRRIEIEDPFVREILGKRTVVDRWLWRTLREGNLFSDPVKGRCSQDREAVETRLAMRA